MKITEAVYVALGSFELAKNIINQQIVDKSVDASDR